MTRLSLRLDSAYEVIHQQQLFFRITRWKGVAKNFIVTEVSEDADELGNSDIEKISKVVEAAECGEED